MGNKTNKDLSAGITVGELRRELEVFPDDAELYFGGLTFYRLKTRGPKLVALEFNQQVYRHTDGTLVIEDLK